MPAVPASDPLDLGPLDQFDITSLQRQAIRDFIHVFVRAVGVLGPSRIADLIDILSVAPDAMDVCPATSSLDEDAFADLVTETLSSTDDQLPLELGT